MEIPAVPRLEDFIIKYEADGEERRVLYAEKAVQYLMSEGLFFIDCSRYIENDWEDPSKWEVSRKRSLFLTVNCNDVFAWGCADTEEVEHDEWGDLESDDLYMLLRDQLADGRWGSVRWACRKRQQKPQPPIVRDMKTAGVWDEEMESLPDNTDDAAVAAAVAAFASEKPDGD